jgi:superfamily II DNA or RNA helicase
MIVRLRPHQVDAITAIDEQLALVRSTLREAATGTGKTIEIVELTRREIEAGGRTLILVNRDELVRQTRRKVEDLGIVPDIERGRDRANLFARVVIASVQTMKGARLERWLRTHFTRIFVDECHHAVAPGYRAILEHFTSAKIVGWTATPDRADGKPLGQVFESVAHRYGIKQAIADGNLVPILARRVVVDGIDLSRVEGRRELDPEQLAEIMAEEGALRGVAVPLLELAGDRRTIAFCVDVMHAEQLARVLNELRPGCARAVSGRTDDEQREELLAAHNRGDFQFLTNCDLLIEGYDSPAVSCVAMVRPTKSRGRFVQCAGRGLRLLGMSLAESIANGKGDCLLLDFTGTAGRHRLIGPADCLAGNIEDELRALIEEILAGEQLDIPAAIAKAEDELSKRREQLKLEAVVKFHAECIDPFIGYDERVRARTRTKPAYRIPPTVESLDYLKKCGVALSKLPKHFSEADALALIARFKERSQQKLCAYRHAKQIKCISRKFCTLDTESMDATTGARLYNKLRDGDWKFAAIAETPEVKIARGIVDASWGAA